MPACSWKPARRARWGVRASLLLAGACGGPEKTPLPLADPSFTTVWSWESGADGEPFVEVVGAVTLADGSTVVADHGTGLVHFLSALGGPAAVAGGIGSGPGEFRQIVGLGVAGFDTVWVFDRSLARVTFFTGRGELVGTTAVPAEAVGFGGAVVGMTVLGSFVVVQQTLPFPKRGTDGRYRDSTSVMLYDTTNGSLRLLGHFPLFDLRTANNALGPAVAVLPFSPRLHVAAGGGGREVIVGFSESPVLRVFSGLGVLQDSLEAPFDRRVVLTEEIGAVLKRRSKARHQSVPLSRVDFPAAMPYYARLLGDRWEGVWVEEVVPPGDSPRWILLSDAARGARRITLPMGFHLLEASGDTLLGVMRSGEGADIVVRGIVNP